MKYNNLFEKEKKQKEIIFIYQNNNPKNTKIKIFGKNFVLNNKKSFKYFKDEQPKNI